ncbi:dimethylarginine dimethylaminohydrolase family protein [Streptomyces qinglanensis]|uniref:dimethylarginine dimethylaminohydrolase family protein n=1 Tax=Streptomyces qinglanensis TaxID=943816 RepID=UPI00379A61FE
MLAPHATSEYGTLRRVAMRYAGNFTRPLEGPGVHPVLARQQTTSTWAPYDTARVHTQQNALITLLRRHGAEVVLLDAAPGCSAQHYPRDLGFVIDDVLFLARLNSAHRLPEAAALTRLASAMPKVARLPEGTIEGGDVMLHDGSVLVGLGEETSPAGAEALQWALSQLCIDREVIPVRFAVEGIVHLDDHFAIVAPRTALIHRAVFLPAQVRWFEQHFELIEITDDEALAVHGNVLAIAPRAVVVARGSDRIARQLAARDIEVLAVDYSEVTKLPGALRCTTLPLLRS